MNGDELQFLRIADRETNAISVAVRFLKPAKAAPVFVWFCGFKSDMESLKATAVADWARERGAGCLRFDYSGHGRSEGRFEEGTVSRWLAEADAVVRQAGKGPFVFVGSSMGGWIALLLARGLAPQMSEALRGIGLIAPAWDMTRLMWENAPDEAREAIERDGIYFRPSRYGDGPYPIARRLIEDGERHLFGAGPVSVGSPVRILHGRQDPDVPWMRSIQLIDVLQPADVRLTIVKDGEHRMSRPQDLRLLYATLSEFL
jgi:pimeloyl-ACP methyl ester carboxylesterase